MIRLELRGPGACFGGVVNCIQEALESHGAKVSLDDECPEYQIDGTPEDLSQYEVRFKITHLPWGG